MEITIDIDTHGHAQTYMHIQTHRSTNMKIYTKIHSHIANTFAHTQFDTDRNLYNTCPPSTHTLYSARLKEVSTICIKCTRNNSCQAINTRPSIFRTYPDTRNRMLPFSLTHSQAVKHTFNHSTLNNTTAITLKIQHKRTDNYTHTS